MSPNLQGQKSSSIPSQVSPSESDRTLEEPEKYGPGGAYGAKSLPVSPLPTSEGLKFSLTTLRKDTLLLRYKDTAPRCSLLDTVRWRVPRKTGVWPHSLFTGSSGQRRPVSGLGIGLLAHGVNPESSKTHTFVEKQTGRGKTH